MFGDAAAWSSRHADVERVSRLDRAVGVRVPLRQRQPMGAIAAPAPFIDRTAEVATGLHHQAFHFSAPTASTSSAQMADTACRNSRRTAARAHWSSVIEVPQGETFPRQKVEGQRRRATCEVTARPARTTSDAWPAAWYGSEGATPDDLHRASGGAHGAAWGNVPRHGALKRNHPRATRGTNSTVEGTRMHLRVASRPTSSSLTTPVAPTPHLQARQLRPAGLTAGRALSFIRRDVRHGPASVFFLTRRVTTNADELFMPVR